MELDIEDASSRQQELQLLISKHTTLKSSSNISLLPTTELSFDVGQILAEDERLFGT